MYLDHRVVAKIARILSRLNMNIMLLDTNGQVILPDGNDRELTLPEALKGKRPIADVWIFMMASFPRGTSRTPRVFQAFDLGNWSAYAVSGEHLRTSGCTSYISESTLRRLGLEPFPLKKLKRILDHDVR